MTPCGTWPSPISSEALVADALALSDTQWLPDGSVLWQEGRPAERGRVTLICQAPDGSRRELTPAPWNVRTRVHEYGGRSYLAAGGLLFFSHFDDQRLYRLALDDGGEPTAITPAVPASALRYADLSLSPDGRHLYAVREDHRGLGEAVNTLVRLDMAAGESEGEIVASGCDFYAAPRLSPDGRQLAWLQWRHPDMPWDGTELLCAAVQADGRLAEPQRLAGSRTESVVQPLWSPGGVLHMVSDRSGWWNLYRSQGGGWQALAPMPAEFAQPLWNLGAANYGFVKEHSLLCSVTRDGAMSLALLDTRNGAYLPLNMPWNWYASVMVQGVHCVALAGSATQEMSVIRLRLDTTVALKHEVLQRGSALRADEAFTASPRPLSYPSANGRTAHALHYAPRHAGCSVPAGEAPPLIVFIHGGPTSATAPVFRPAVQYWTSRGYAVLDVNYAGSSGYGRAYRELLKGQWGVVDVEDCIAGAQALVAQGLADGRRLIIRGGSAGGYTTLAALTFHSVFRCGASLYGIGDLAALARDTHKFEARYLDSLVGPWPAQEALYRERSPLFHTERLNCALILFQGSEDKAVPPEQSRQMAAAVRAKGLPVAYIEFVGEGHGFRQAANIRRTVEAEESFYAQVLGFVPAAGLAPLEIDNR